MSFHDIIFWSLLCSWDSVLLPVALSLCICLSLSPLLYSVSFCKYITIHLSSYLSMDICVFPSRNFFHRGVLQWTFLYISYGTHMQEFLQVHTFWFIGLGHFKFTLNCWIIFQNNRTSLCLYLQCTHIPVAPKPHQLLILSEFVNCCKFSEYQLCFIVF